MLSASSPRRWALLDLTPPHRDRRRPWHPWTLATEFQLSRPGQDWGVPVEIQNSGRFFRVRIVVP